jgi:hypothetical protein
VSVYVEFDQWGRMGNRMFQYAFGYLLAIQKNVNLITSGLPNFNIPSTTSNTAPINPIFTRNFGNNCIDLELLLETKRDIIINSHLQRAEYYLPHRETLRSIFSVETEPSINENKLVLHVRETDYTQINCFLGYEYYSNLIKRSNFTDVIIVTDNSNCDTVKQLISDGCILNTEGYVDKFECMSDNRGMIDFMTLLKSENIAISQSSFSWWAAFLGNHKTIYFPDGVNGMWSTTPGPDDIDLIF